MELKGKKLLLLGAPALASDVIKTAKEMGVYTMATDWYTPEQMPAKLEADEYFMVSNADVKAVTKLIKEEKIDGVLTGFTDSTLPYYQQICEEAGIPCYATAKQIEITTHKVKFKKLCEEFGIPTIEEFCLEPESGFEEISNLKFPVIVKPVDNSGGRGISVCYDKKELEDGYRHALSFSASKKVVVERYMTSKEVSIFYYLQDGNVYPTLMGDRHTRFTKDGLIPLPNAYTFPSVHTEQYLKNQNDKVVNMFKSLGMKDGVIFIQAFWEAGECYFYEMGYRLTGSLEYKIIDKLFEVNPLKKLIQFALTGSAGNNNDFRDVNPNHSNFACNITFLGTPGKIAAIKGIEEVLGVNGVIDVVPSYKVGDSISEQVLGTLRQVVIRAFAVAETKKELAGIMDKIQNTIKVISENGENMLLEPFDVSELEK